MTLERLRNAERLGVNKVDVVVVRANGESLSIRRVVHCFDPLCVLGLCKESLPHVVQSTRLSGINIGPVDISDGDDTSVIGNSKLVKLGAECNAS